MRSFIVAVILVLLLGSVGYLGYRNINRQVEQQNVVLNAMISYFSDLQIKGVLPKPVREVTEKKK